MATAVKDEFQGHLLEDLTVGMTADYARTVSADDIVAFADVSGDNNPVHLDADYARTTVFKGPIAHGMLTASFISTVLGTKLPGYGCIYLSQDLRFRAPVRVGDTVRATVEVIEIQPEKKRVVLRTTCSVGDKVVLEGTAVMMVSSRADRPLPELPKAQSLA